MRLVLATILLDTRSCTFYFMHNQALLVYHSFFWLHAPSTSSTSILFSGLFSTYTV